MSSNSSLLVSGTIQALFIGLLSNFIAQCIAASQKDGSYEIDVTDLLFYMVFSAVTCPPNILWQIYLEETWPGSAGSESSSSDTQKDEKGQLTSANPTRSSSASKRNFVVKFILDQTISAAVNTVAYIAAVSAFKGADAQGITRDVFDDFWPLLKSGWNFWPLVAVLNFTIIPLEYRTLFGSMAGLLWNVFLSLRATL